MSFQLSVSRETREGRWGGGLVVVLEGGGGGGIVVVLGGFVVSRPEVRRAARASLKYVVFGVWNVGSSRVSRMCSSESCAGSDSPVAVSSVGDVVVVVGEAGAVVYPTITRPTINGSESSSSSLTERRV